VRAWLAGESVDWRRAPLDLALELDAPDISFVTGLSPGLRRLQGAASARLALTGSTSAPELAGEAQLAGIDLRLLEGGRSVEQCTGRLEFAGTRVQLLDLSGAYGAGPVRVSGWFDFARGAEQLDLEIEGEELLLARAVGLRLRGDTKLHVAGPIDALHASGTLALREGRYTRSFELFGGLGARTAPPQARGRGIELFSLRDEPFASMTFDVQVSARDPFAIDNNVVSAEIRPDLRLIGTGRAPELVGALFIDDGRVSLPACKLDVTSGSVVFRRADPLVPYLDFVGLTRLRGYEVTMHASGPYEDAKLVFTAIPPLSEEQARVLVLTGQTPEEALTAEGGLRTAQSVATFVGTDLIGQWFGGEGGGGDSWLDRFELEAGTEVSRAGVEAYRASFRLTGVGHRTRKPGQATYLRAEQDVYERMIFGLRFLFRLW
jgi:autotransporter translocation and assembly factor TamB